MVPDENAFYAVPFNNGTSTAEQPTERRSVLLAHEILTEQLRHFKKEFEIEPSEEDKRKLTISAYQGADLVYRLSEAES